MSMKPGAITRPSTSTVRVAASSAMPFRTMRPSLTPTSARRRTAPVPSTTVPPRSRRSSIAASDCCAIGGDCVLYPGAFEERRVRLRVELDGVAEHEVLVVILCQQTVLDHLIGLLQHLGHVRHIPVRDI